MITIHIGWIVLIVGISLIIGLVAGQLSVWGKLRREHIIRIGRWVYIARRSDM